VVAKVIPTVRKVVNEEPLLYQFDHMKSKREENDPVSTSAARERERREGERRLYEELSRYYPRGKGKWRRPELLLQGKHGIFTGGHSTNPFSHQCWMIWRGIPTSSGGRCLERRLLKRRLRNPLRRPRFESPLNYTFVDFESSHFCFLPSNSWLLVVINTRVMS
jgi:hypothetical protein